MKQAPLINIPSYIADLNYRYKMPKPILKIESKGNGVKTNLVNMHEIAKALKCPDQYPLKYLALELGTQAEYKFKNDNDVTCIIKGQFSEDVIRKSMDKFIEKYILCPKCKYPEMYIKLKNKLLQGICDSCGNQQELDNNHKLASYIQKNLPEHQQSIKKEDEQLGLNINIVTNAQQTQKSTSLSAEQVSLDSEQLENFITQLKETYGRISQGKEIADVEMADMMIAQDIKRFNLKRQLKDRVCYMIFQSMFNEDPTVGLEKNQKLLTGLLDQIDPENSGWHQLLNLQHLLRRQKIDDKYFATLLYRFYENEYIEDQFILKWFNQSEEWTAYKSTNFLFDEAMDQKYRELAGPMIDWLKKAQEEGEYEEEGEGEETQA